MFKSQLARVERDSNSLPSNHIKTARLLRKNEVYSTLRSTTKDFPVAPSDDLLAIWHDSHIAFSKASQEVLETKSADDGSEDAASRIKEANTTRNSISSNQSKLRKKFLARALSRDEPYKSLLHKEAQLTSSRAESASFSSSGLESFIEDSSLSSINSPRLSP